MFLIYTLNESVEIILTLRFCTEKSEKLVKLTKECTLLKACTYNIVINLFECLKTLQITAACGIAVIFCVFRKA